MWGAFREHQAVAHVEIGVPIRSDRHEKTPGGEQPVGVAVWAMADDLVARRIDGGDNRLTAVEWKSGPNMRIVELVAPFGAEAEMREQVVAAKPIL